MVVVVGMVRLDSVLQRASGAIHVSFLMLQRAHSLRCSIPRPLSYSDYTSLVIISCTVVRTTLNLPLSYTLTHYLSCSPLGCGPSGRLYVLVYEPVHGLVGIAVAYPHCQLSNVGMCEWTRWPQLQMDELVVEYSCSNDDLTRRESNGRGHFGEYACSVDGQGLR